MGIRPEALTVSTVGTVPDQLESQLSYQWKTSRRWPRDASLLAMTALGSGLPSASFIHRPQSIPEAGACWAGGAVPRGAWEWLPPRITITVRGSAITTTAAATSTNMAVLPIRGIRPASPRRAVRRRRRPTADA